MRNFRKLSFLAAALGVCAAFLACGDDDNIVRTRSDGGGTDGASEAADGPTPGLLACGVPIPTSYDSPSFALNAKEELDLKARVLALGDKMKSAEGATPLPVTTADLQAIFTAGPPSLRSIATASAQSTVDTYLTQFGDSATKTWKPEDVEGDAEAGAPSGGKYGSSSIVSAVGLDLRQATNSVLLDGSLYNYALALASGALTEATIDRLLALYGATPARLGTTGGDAGDAGTDVDQLIAAFASNRDSKINSPGPYRKIRSALIIAKAAAAAGADKCRTDLDGALKIYFAEWEKTAYLTVIYYLNLAGSKAVALPQEGPAALQAFGAAIGFTQSFKGIPQDRRKITDAQIDGVLATIGAATPYQLITRSGDRITAFNTALQQIGAIYALTPTEIEEAKKAY